MNMPNIISGNRHDIDENLYMQRYRTDAIISVEIIETRQHTSAIKLNALI
jgi:hypothetical protein